MTSYIKPVLIALVVALLAIYVANNVAAVKAIVGPKA